MVLTNAVYFRGRWATEFAPGRTKAGPFHRADGATRAHPMMAQEGEFGYAAGDGFRLARLPYQGGQVSMYVVLPDSGQAVAAILAQLTGPEFRAFATAAEARPLAVVLPRFTLECGADLARPVAALGAAIAFDRERAEFRRLLAPARGEPRRAWLDGVVQRTFVEVNEEGTEAAAVTAVEVGVDSAPPRPEPFVVDRPFVFAIRHDPSGALLFLGQVTDPAGAC
jgi:serpin B